MTTTATTPVDHPLEPPDCHEPRPTVDMRLAASAIAAWLAALTVVRAPPLAAAAGGVGCVLVALAAALIAARHRRAEAPWTSRPKHPRPSALPGAALALVAVAAVLGAGAGQMSARSLGLLPELTRAGAVGTLSGRVVGEPALLPPAWPGGPARARCLLAVDGVAAHGRTSGGTGTVLVLGPPALAQVPFGARISVVGRVQAGAAGARVVAVLLTSADPEAMADPSLWDAAATGVRDDLRGLAERLPGDGRALLPGVTVGDTSGVPEDLAAAMRVAGLTHVMAVSGAHFSLVAVLVLTLATLARLRRGARAVLVVIAMAGMVLLVHPSPSVVRAAAMGLVAAIGVLIGRPHRAPPALCAAVVFLLVADPWLAGELGFILSVLATGGLVLLGGPLVDRWSPRLGRPAAQVLALPVAAQLVCAPAILLATPTVALYAVPANVLVAPALAPATVLGLAAGCLAPWWPQGAHALSLGAGAACWWIGAVARGAAGAPGAQVGWQPGPVGILLLTLATAAAVRLMVARRRG